jgi:hypothetical protein
MKTYFLILFAFAAFVFGNNIPSAAQKKDSCVLKLKIRKSEGKSILDTTIIFSDSRHIKNIDSLVHGICKDMNDINMDLDIQMDFDSMTGPEIKAFDDSLFVYDFSLRPEDDVLIKKYFRHGCNKKIFDEYFKANKRHKCIIENLDEEDFGDFDMLHHDGSIIKIEDGEITITDGQSGKTIIVEKEKKSKHCKKGKKSKTYKIIVTDDED